jgi:hypothetical protein
VEDLRDHADLGAGAGDGLADVVGFDVRKLFCVLFDERREPAKEPRPIGGTDGAPFREGRLRAGDRGIVSSTPAGSSSAIVSSVAGLVTIKAIWPI